MKYYRVVLIGRYSGAPYTYVVNLADNVPALAAKEVALALHGQEIAEGKARETVYLQGVKIRRAPRCWSIRVRSWRIVRCCQADAHIGEVHWHLSPKGHLWKVNPDHY